MQKTLGMMLILVGMSGLALAIGGVGVPEIDGGSAVTALALLSGAALVIRSKKK